MQFPLLTDFDASEVSVRERHPNTSFDVDHEECERRDQKNEIVDHMHEFIASETLF